MEIGRIQVVRQLRHLVSEVIADRDRSGGRSLGRVPSGGVGSGSTWEGRIRSLM